MTAPQTAISPRTPPARRRPPRPSRSTTATAARSAAPSGPIAIAPLTYSGVPNAGEPGPHVHVRGERAVDHRRAGPDDLGQRDAEQRLGVLLGDRPRERDRRHRAGERERRGDDRLAGLGHLDEPVAHRAVEAERRVRVDDRHQAPARATSSSRVDAAGQRRRPRARPRRRSPRTRGTATSCRARSRRSGTCRGGGSRPAGRSARAGRRPPGG